MNVHPLDNSSKTELAKPLSAFLRQIYGIFSELNIDPIVYGGLAYHYHTKDSSLPISDIDLLVPEKNFRVIQKSLDKLQNVSYQTMPYHSIEVFKKELRIDIDSLESYLGSRSQQSNLAKFGGLGLKILNRNSLISIYRESLKNMPADPKLDEKRNKYKTKLAKLEEGK